ncbi:hypothetical protein AU184_13955 [Mycolicibacterium novocastrense]|uniref:DUF732 domain-containing protein n=2 Tax=Mycolicibacterium novocastrense TaxID=59813 RepID=A0AAW5SEH6_MYCNV|nr:DUF732 domain-containing protein [Mycolicibacterium novocastrense]KUH69918.1 hypothetical protein AU183_10270 [Mycolicibacterium novocastrense]KUH78091.1 hypothetical protein AU072_09035 [Mycolicibacterium novocastrense]KUH79426.1 hypothetical protein AU184_13955 [Mycolicibacterium novocastrense]MCV7022510.1 DUF732 domain-containing protein [Mycolicibacterium novocastrense]GAT08175.1 uncharacterized protein RMCN_1308 [Mycolicibacterium novocastrense]
MKAISAGTIFAGLAASAFFLAPLAAASPEDAYLNVLGEAGVTWPGATPDNMIAAGKGVCTDWANGATLEGEIAGLAEHLDPHDAGVLVGAATAAFCPEYEAKVTEG